MTESAHGSRGHGADAAGSALRPGAALGYARALAAAVGRPALLRALPLYMGLALPAGVIFGPNGMHPADLADAAAAAAGVRLVLWGGWTVATLPVAHALLDGESSAYLRWLPAPRAFTAVALAVMLLAAQAAFGLFWWAARGGVDAAAGMALPAAAQAAILVAPRHRLEALARAIGVAGAAALVLVAPSGAIVLAAGLAGLVVAVPAAWTRSVEIGTRRARALRGTGPAVILAQLYLRALWRTRPGLVTRTLLTTTLGAGLVVLASAANELALADRARFSALVAAVSLSLAAGGLAVPVRESERALGWILDGAGTRWHVRAAARSLAAAVAGGALGGMHGMIAGLDAGGAGPVGLAGMVRLAGVAALLGAGLAVAAVRCAVWAEAAARDRAVRRRRAETPGLSEGVDIDGARVIAGVAGMMMAAAVALHVLGEAAAALVACAGLIAAGSRGASARRQR